MYKKERIVTNYEIMRCFNAGIPIDAYKKAKRGRKGTGYLKDGVPYEFGEGPQEFEVELVLIDIATSVGA